MKGPVVNINELKQRSHGLIVLSGGPENGFISQELNSSNKNIIKSSKNMISSNKNTLTSRNLSLVPIIYYYDGWW